MIWNTSMMIKQAKDVVAVFECVLFQLRWSRQAREYRMPCVCVLFLFNIYMFYMLNVNVNIENDQLDGWHSNANAASLLLCL